MNKIPILICIDVEPDDREIDPDVRHDWKGFEKSYEFFTQLRPRLKAVTGSPVHFSGSSAWIPKSTILMDRQPTS